MWLWLTSWLSNPLMLGLGGLAVGVPILIHLLNKRRFKIVEWAAMDFLFQADKKNRRRVKLENFILLMLRCLAMLLLGLLLARPFLPSELMLGAQTEKIERVIVLDDSLSQKVLVGNRTGLEVAKENVKDLLKSLADSNATEDWLTLSLTSNPDEPLYVNEPVTKETVNPLLAAIDDLECTDSPADYVKCFQVLKNYTSGERRDTNRVVYVYSDMRQRDWTATSEGAADFAAHKVLQEISENVLEGFVVDCGSDLDQNLAITKLRTLDLQVASKRVSYDVEVANFGSQTAKQVRVLFQIDDTPPKYKTIESIAPGARKSIEFIHVFAASGEGELSMTDDEAGIARVDNYRVRAEIDRQSLGDQELQNDQLVDDSQRSFASRVLDGIPILLVDGDPSLTKERSETYSLNLLRVWGTGFKMTTVTTSQFETVPLAKYRVVFLCNVDTVSEERLKELERWVGDGGNVVFMPGNQVDAGTFNQNFYRDGEGLSPIMLKQITGFPAQNDWVNFEVDPQVHPMLQTVVNTDRAFLGTIAIFSFWTSELGTAVKSGEEPRTWELLDGTSMEARFHSYNMDDGQVTLKDENDSEVVCYIGEMVLPCRQYVESQRNITIPLRFSDSENSAAMAEQPYGDGLVTAFTIPGDSDWSHWPANPFFYPMMIDLVNYLVGSDAEQAVATIGGEVRQSVDLALYQNQIAFRDPKKDKVEKVAKPADAASAEDGQTTYYVTFDGVQQAGFYEMELKRHSGETDKLLFASNVNSKEGQLKRLDTDGLDKDFFGENFSLLDKESVSEQKVKGSTVEFWPYVIVLLLIILGTEQFLGWFWGRKR